MVAISHYYLYQVGIESKASGLTVKVTKPLDQREINTWLFPRDRGLKTLDLNNQTTQTVIAACFIHIFR